MYMRVMSSPIGPLTIHASDTGIRQVDFGRTSDQQDDHPWLDQASTQLNEYFEGKRQTFDVPFDIQGSTRQQQVWRTLTLIPFGQTCSYQDVAERTGNIKACQAIGQMVGKNPLPILIPCHRVLGKTGLGGFSGGLDIKKKLLMLEGSSCYS